MTKELLDQFEGKQNVTHVIGDNGEESWLTQETSFVNEAFAKGATILDIHKKNPILLLFNDDDKAVGRYYMTKKLQGQTPSQIVAQKENLYFFESWYFEKRCWIPCVGILDNSVNRNPQVILKDGYYSVVDKAGNIIVPPGKYGYIDFFDTHGLARVKINGGVYLANPEISIKEKWGIIDTKGTEVLPVIYTEVWKFYGKNLKRTKVWKGGVVTFLIDGVFEEFYQERVYRYDFYLETQELVLREDWSNGEYDACDPDYNSDSSYSIWDAFEDNEEAAAASDFEW